MNETIILLCLIQVAIVILLDLTDGMEAIKRWVWHYSMFGRPYKPYSFKPWDCSLCMTHHIGLLFLIFSGSLTLGLYVVLLFLAILTPATKNLIMLVRDFLDAIIFKLQSLVDRIITR